ncbi:MAG TPA: DUF1501 domain-containing protein, partial [Gemmataceae bacterium]|nr:DUF1501 domain-containing protein [Gemmataceae bacterium]
MSVTRRDFLRTSAITAAGLATGPVLAANSKDVNCIFLMLVGGPSQLDTWDPKPDAPSDVRSQYRPISTRIAGAQFTELFPKMAVLADQFAIVRSMHHTEAPIHETGHQLLQTGRLAENGREAPHFGAQLSFASRQRGFPLNVLLPGPIGFTGVNVGHGQTAGNLGVQHEPVAVPFGVDDDPMRERYGDTEFGDNCLRAARLVERGSRFVTVNMFQTVYDTITWDCHAAGGSLRSELADYRGIGTTFDLAYTALLEDLRQRGLLSNTLVVATGEFGRTPYRNREGGRDHWAGVWTMLLAGAGVRGGTVIGSSDRLGGEPKDTPVGPEHLAGTICHTLNLPSERSGVSRPMLTLS